MGRSDHDLEFEFCTVDVHQTEQLPELRRDVVFEITLGDVFLAFT